MSEIAHLSYSSISSYLTCSRAWKHHYIDKLPEPTTPALIFGSAIHDTVEKLISANTVGNEATSNPLGMAGGGEMFRELYQARLEKETDIDWQGTTIEDQLRLGERILTTPEVFENLSRLRAKVDAEGKPMIERKVELSVPGVGVPVIGYIDIILADGTPADFKTASRAWSQSQAENSMQSLFYLAALNQAGEEINWKFRHLVVTKTLTPKFQELKHAHEPRELFFLFDLIRSVWAGISAGVFVPNPDCWKCSPKYCPHFMSCRGK
nr:MAG TPA: PD-(D/E)XK nuclease superfamily protein [Bacteriophage sp.]